MATLDVELNTVSETPLKPKRAPRKRVASRVDGDTAPKPRTPRPRTRKAAPKTPAIDVAVSSPVIEQDESSILRKAPVRTVASRPHTSKRPIYIVVGTFVAALGIAAGIGVSDTGQIDVQAKINSQNEVTSTNSDGTSTVTVPVAESAAQAPIPVSSLRGRGVGSAAPVETPSDIVSSTDGIAASSTQDVASTTPQTTEEEVPVVENVDDVPTNETSSVVTEPELPSTE